MESSAYVFCSASNHPCSATTYLQSGADEFDHVNNRDITGSEVILELI
ncbi:MAG: hypothetical protein CM15mP49_11140 [Actinomycetota bacterium]|nr:MAG: hypothetical protein CM15mP49_11140 [Actinomycetota bacterium]